MEEATVGLVKTADLTGACGYLKSARRQSCRGRQAGD
jgi:hypothetical protein